jgi:SAM-dependent methyltransferase
MGAAPDNLDIIADLYARGLLPKGAAIADIGCQQLRGATASDVRRFLGYFGCQLSDAEVGRLATHNTFISEHLTRVGFRYRTFDVVEAPMCEYFDLNTDRVSRRWLRKFNLVLNFGTTEHVLNQLAAMRAMHDFAKPDGLIYSLFIRGGNMDHGLLHYSDRFVDLLCQANAYEPIWREDQRHECTWIVLRKTSARPFCPPLDIQLGEGFPPLLRRKRRLFGLLDLLS